MVVAVDFDGVMDNPIVQRVVRKMVRENNEVWVVTMRKDNSFNFDIIIPVINKIGLTEHNVIFCNGKPKIEMLQMINADIYIDNITDEFEAIKTFTNTTPLLWV